MKLKDRDPGLENVSGHLRRVGVQNVPLFSVGAQVPDMEDQVVEDVEDVAEGEDEGDATVETDEGTPPDAGTEVTEGEKVRFSVCVCWKLCVSSSPSCVRGQLDTITNFAGGRCRRRTCSETFFRC